MKLYNIIWLVTFGIVGVAIVTKTSLLKNLINKVKNPPHGFFYDGQSGQAAPPAQIDPSILASISGGGRTDNSSTRIEGPGRISGSFQQGFYFYDNGGAGAYGSGGGGGGGVIPDVPSRGGGRQSWGSGNFPQGGYFDPLVNERYPSVINSQYLPNDQQPNFTQPLVPPNINKEIESQQPKKQHHHKKKQKETHDESQQPDQVYTQVECPSDPNSVPCGYNCYINGQLMTVDCTTPYNYNPYRSGGPPTGPGPSQNNIHPTTPNQNLQNNNSQYNPYAASHNQPSYSPPSYSHNQPPTHQDLGPGTSVGTSHPTQNKNFTNGCGHGNDAWISCRAGIGTGSHNRPTPESGRDNKSVSDRIGNSQHFYAIYDFNVTLGNPVKGHPFSAEITGGYNGSNNNEAAVGVTIGVNGDGTPLGRTEDHYAPNGHQRAKGDYNELCKKSCGGVTRVPMSTHFQLVWCADKDSSGHVIYRGYYRTGEQEYLIGYFVDPPEGGNPCSGCRHDGRTNVIDFTRPGVNTYLRGRTDQMGNNCPTGRLYVGSFTPSPNVITS